jgi:peptidoglycan-associated lipoprotein
MMKMKQVLKVSVITGGLILLVGCSTTGGKNANGTVSYPAAAGVTTSGLGPNATIAGLNTSSSPNRMRSPYDQVYFFDYDQSAIHGEDLGSIDVQGNYLAAHPNSRILITGNTDERGSREYNIALGNRRAITVEHRLKMDGVAERQINAVSYGAEKPISPGNTEQDFAQNRNVQLIYKQK